MNLERTAMLAALNTVRPALASKDLIEELTHCWFDGKTVTAYNDADLGIQVPFASPFKGGIRGQLLLGLLTNSRAKDIVIEPGAKENGPMILKAARARVELAVLAPERAVWAFPKSEPSKGFAMKAGFLEGLKSVLISVGNDTSIPEKQGVTLDANGKGDLTMFTTDAKSIARFDFSDPKLKQKFRAIIPTAFCQQLLRLCAEGDVLELRKDCVIASAADGTLLYARLVDCEQPRDFFEIFDRELPAGLDDIEGLFEIPGRLSLALERAIVLMDGASEGRLDLIIGDGKIKLNASAPGRGELADAVTPVPLEGVPEKECSVDPDLLKRAIPLCTHMAFGKCLFMDDGAGFSYLVAYKGGAR
jgi:DNA polymerase III sliding clamp (beta) subunit (PCNA family)